MSSPFETVALQEVGKSSNTVYTGKKIARRLTVSINAHVMIKRKTSNVDCSVLAGGEIYPGPHHWCVNPVGRSATHGGTSVRKHTTEELVYSADKQ